MTLDQKLLLYAQQFEDQHAPENITTTLREAAAEIERLLAANRDVMLHWDVLRADYERLRAALELFACDCIEDKLCKFPHACRNYVARTALEGK